MESLTFELPTHLEATEPPEARGLARDDVRLMVSQRHDDRITHAHFRDLGQFLAPGDLLVINTSGTLNAALPATRVDGGAFELHLSTHLPADLWLVEARKIDAERKTTQPFFDLVAGETLSLPADGAVTVLAPHSPPNSRWWTAQLKVPYDVLPNLNRHGFPIRYSYVPRQWPAHYYQTVYATEMGSAEMPSAGRAFTPELITRLVAHGVQFAPLILHTGVASLEDHEPPYEEYYRVPLETARRVNATRAAGQRVIAVGTTVVRALETVTDADGVAHPGEGWTKTIVTPATGLRSVDGLLTGLHEPRASHLDMLAALAGRDHLRLAYDKALQHGYLWHEFGDLHLILP
ncbi:MAG: S-adenosylmethionine:tRNA ribosyltransferase-isomerase [Anaerolineales bacterium]